MEVAHALLYVYQKNFFHNDNKADNILLTNNDSGLHSVLIDFGKCRKVSNAKWYKLNANKQAKYFKEHGILHQNWFMALMGNHLHLVYFHLVL